MKKYRFIPFKSYAVFAILLLIVFAILPIVLAVFIYTSVYNNQRVDQYIAANALIVILPLCSIMGIWGFLWMFQVATIDEKGIRIRNLMYKILDFKWEEIKKIETSKSPLTSKNGFQTGCYTIIDERVEVIDTPGLTYKKGYIKLPISKKVTTIINEYYKGPIESKNVKD